MKKAVAKKVDSGSDTSSAYESDSDLSSSDSDGLQNSKTLNSKPSTSQPSKQTPITRRTRAKARAKTATNLKFTLRETKNLDLNASQQTLILSTFASKKIPNKEHYIMFSMCCDTDFV
jgi:hypothetical protein